jgi:hypothetical protein
MTGAKIIEHLEETNRLKVDEAIIKTTPLRRKNKELENYQAKLEDKNIDIIYLP